MTSERPSLEDFGLKTNALLADQVRGLMGRLIEAEHEIERLRATLAKSCEETRHEDYDRGCSRAVLAELQIERMRGALWVAAERLEARGHNFGAADARRAASAPA